MPLGTAIFTIENLGFDASIEKSIINCTYPRLFKISRGLMHKIAQFFLQSRSKKDEVLEFPYGDKLVLVFSHTTGSDSLNEVFTLILSPPEVSNKNDFIELIQNNIDNFYKQNKQDRFLNFEIFARLFFGESSSKKLLIIGFPAAGKTCIKKTFFDKEDPNTLLGVSAPEPTRGLVHFIYSWFNAEIGILDSSGQEFNSYVSGDNEESINAFEGSDIIIYVFDVINWQNQEEDVIANLRKIIKTKDKISPDSKIYAFCHKIDLLSDPDKKSILKVKDILERELNIKASFSSIKPEYIHTLFRSMELILNETMKPK